MKVLFDSPATVLVALALCLSVLVSAEAQEICDDKKTTCFNGGKCTKQGDNGKWGCDCTAADGLFAGKYCESKATAMCEAADDGLETDSWFCTNNGSCRDNASDVNRKCSCPDGYKGPHCEVKKDTAVAEEQGDPEQCNLQCKQGGQCVHGFKNHAKEHKNIDELYFLKKKEINGMHCICPEGFAGVQCDIKLDKCGGQYCYHGATCLQVRTQSSRSQCLFLLSLIQISISPTLCTMVPTLIYLFNLLVIITTSHCAL
jgi:hypothetical protein